MNFNVDLKKIVREAGTVVSRVVQLTEEKLGTSEKTELEAHFENLALRADTTKQWTEKLLKDTESVLTPNPGNRVEDFLFEKIEKKRPNRLSNLEYLGQDMIDAGNEFGPGTLYGASLMKVGQTEQKLGQIERDFIANVNQSYLTPLKKYLDGEMKTISNERGVLESKRLDLDSCKNRVRKARSMLGQPTAERDLRVAQSEFDRQVEITRLLLEDVSNSLSTHHRCLHDLVNSQQLYYEQCLKVMNDLKADLSSMSPQSGQRSKVENSFPSKPATTRKAKVLCSYKARHPTEIDLTGDEIISVWNISENETTYVMAERGNQIGRVPVAYIEIS